MMSFIVALIIFLTHQATGQQCCSKKTVGGILYNLVGSQAQGYASQYNCTNNCLYTQDSGDPNKKFCFKPGQLESQCSGKSCSCSCQQELTESESESVSSHEDEEPKRTELIFDSPQNVSIVKPWASGQYNSLFSFNGTTSFMLHLSSSSQF